MIRVNHIRLRSVTDTHVYGSDIPLAPGLNVIQADNSSGKSTSVQAIVFGLGLERSLGPRLEVPLPYAMRERIRRTKESDYEVVRRSYVMLEIENKSGERMTIRRDITGGADPKLMQTWNASIADVDTSNPPQRDFFSADSGAALREGGFHFHLARFIGWDLPSVPRFDGGESPLYIETLFPMSFVEQKRGWNTVLGPFPTFLGIQDMSRRVMEFLLDLDAGKVRRRRSELRKELSLIEARFDVQRKEVLEGTGGLARLDGVPKVPTEAFATAESIRLLVFYRDEWRSLQDVETDIRQRIKDVDKRELKALDEAEGELKQKLGEAEDRHEQLVSGIALLRQDFNLTNEEASAFRKRIASLTEDLRQNQDAKKLQELGSALGEASSSNTCPTCHQHVNHELLPSTNAIVMGVDENIAFIRSQLDLYESSLGSSSELLDQLTVRYRSLNEDLQETRAYIRSLKRDLLRPAFSPSRSEIEEIVRLQGRLDRWASLEEQLDSSIDNLKATAKEAIATKRELNDLGSGKLSLRDNQKLQLLQSMTQRFLQDFGFTSFKPTDITLSEDDFRPQVTTDVEEGARQQRDIGFEASASDYVRLKWSYYIALLNVADMFETKHPGLLVFDEPGQQQMRETDLSSLLTWAAQQIACDQQLIVTTSQTIARVREAVRKGTATIHEYGGYILERLPSTEGD